MKVIGQGRPTFLLWCLFLKVYRPTVIFFVVIKCIANGVVIQSLYYYLTRADCCDWSVACTEACGDVKESHNLHTPCDVRISNNLIHYRHSCTADTSLAIDRGKQDHLLISGCGVTVPAP